MPTLPISQAHIRVPATTANIGPGYDVLGLSLDLWLIINIKISKQFKINITGKYSSPDIELDRSNLIVRCCELAIISNYNNNNNLGFNYNNLPELEYNINNNIPMKCGLGSSSAAAVGGYICGLILCGFTLKEAINNINYNNIINLSNFDKVGSISGDSSSGRDDNNNNNNNNEESSINNNLNNNNNNSLLDIIVSIEGHPDNAAPAIYGGMQIGYKTENNKYKCVSVPINNNYNNINNNLNNNNNENLFEKLKIILFIPKNITKTNTTQTRTLIPNNININDAIYNISRSNIIITALITQKYNLLINCLNEKIHQNKRFELLFNYGDNCINGSIKAGAVFGFLSGAGPAICVLVIDDYNYLINNNLINNNYLNYLNSNNNNIMDNIIKAMVDGAGVEGYCIITKPTMEGVTVVDGDNN